MKSLKSRYQIAQVSSSAYSNMSISNKDDMHHGLNEQGQGYIWVPYIISCTPPLIIQEINKSRKYKIKDIINRM